MKHQEDENQSGGVDFNKTLRSEIKDSAECYMCRLKSLYGKDLKEVTCPRCGDAVVKGVKTE